MQFECCIVTSWNRFRSSITFYIKIPSFELCCFGAAYKVIFIEAQEGKVYPVLWFLSSWVQSCVVCAGRSHCEVPFYLTHPGILILLMLVHPVAVLSIRPENVELRCYGELLLCFNLCKFRSCSYSLPHWTLLWASFVGFICLLCWVPGNIQQSLRHCRQGKVALICEGGKDKKMDETERFIHIKLNGKAAPCSELSAAFTPCNVSAWVWCSARFPSVWQLWAAYGSC